MLVVDLLMVIEATPLEIIPEIHSQTPLRSLSY